ncbi:MAG TPA: AAA family ATPase [Candidatus Limnocylindria bacterium]|nr:AAA family ATPase [Candidatus Limnocylindria bacterium]
MTARRIFLAATGQNRGKTTTSLGLAAAIAAEGHELGFLKPIGQRYVVVDGGRADEDAVLMKAVFGLPDALDHMSPVTLPRHFTTDFVMGRVGDDLAAAVERAYERIADRRDVVLVEGTGHAGVGAVIGLSNASVAAMLEAPVIIVSEGGVGRPIDEIVLNQALFEREGVRVLGAVVNKVNLDTNPQLADVLRRGLGQHGVELLGCIPYSDLLANPSLELLETHLEGVRLSGEPEDERTIGHVAIGAMRAEHAVPLLRDRTLLITPGDRGDLLEAALEVNERTSADVPRVLGIILTGGFEPEAAILARLRSAGLWTFLVRSDTYRTAEAVHDILVKTHPADTQKIATIIQLVGEALHAESLLARL